MRPQDIQNLQAVCEAAIEKADPKGNQPIIHLPVSVVLALCRMVEIRQ